jgi:hypothetical protein
MSQENHKNETTRKAISSKSACYSTQGFVASRGSPNIPASFQVYSHKISLCLVGIFVMIVCSIPSPVFSQSGAAAHRDQQAVALLLQSLSLSGIDQIHRAAQGFTASGTITYYWGGKEVSGPVKIRSRGSDQFYLEATLPNGVRRFSVSHGRGVLVETTGKVNEIPYHNAIKAAVPIIPQLVLLAAVPEASSGVSYLGLSEIAGHQAHKIQIRPVVTQPHGAEELVSRLLRKQVFVDSQSHYVLRITDKTHPNDGFDRELNRQFEYENYVVFQGLAVPTLIRETIADSKISELHIDSVSITNDLGDADFPIQ